MLLGEYLRESGLGDFHTRSGVRECDGERRTHAWMVQDGLIVDITADQFPDACAAVIVTRDSSWHQSWLPAGGYCLASLAHFEGHDHEGRIRDVYESLVAVAAE
ncbi:hypothetical protein EFK50_20355 [Nocardioides marmoriginsengisoli]|uniref:Uncharacterized protein n=2 Tax=Nocardioides marmoriginsengisoli TaxID=661483 RepID=A0A3N0CB27_9ACTN|nr:hypothetical protein EFK50_20355 [Nocardioides marmoriginsengisoli]